MRSTLSNPIAAGADTFSKLMGTFENMENSKSHRELMAQEIADKKLSSERSQRESMFKEEEHARIRKAWGKQAQLEHDEPLLFDATEAETIRAQKGKYFDPTVDWKPNHINSMLYFYNNTNMSDEKLADIKYLKSTFEKIGTSVKGKDGKIDLSGDARLQKSFNSVFGTGKQKDKYGNDVESVPVTAGVKGTDEKMPTAFEMEYKYPAGKTYRHIPVDDGKFVNMAPENPTPKGLTEPGNIDLNKRPVVKNADGSISTVLSRSFEFDGKTVLLPSVSDDGRILSSEETVATYKKTGQHLGIFDNHTDADIYAEALHSSKIWKADLDYYTKESNRDTLRMGEGGDPDAPMHALPAQLLYGKLDALDNMASAVNHYRAKVGGMKFLEQKEAALRQATQSKGVKEAITAWQEDQKNNPGRTVSEQRLSLIKYLPDTMADKDKSAYAKDIIPEKQITEKNPTPASLAVDEAAGNQTAKKARKLMEESEIRKEDAKERSKKKYKTGDEEKDKPASGTLKDKRLEKVIELTELSGAAITKVAQNKIRKNPKIDAFQAADEAKAEVFGTIKKAGSSSKALESLKAIGINEDDAKEAIAEYITKEAK